jgi:hypothetical protein
MFVSISLATKKDEQGLGRRRIFGGRWQEIDEALDAK